MARVSEIRFVGYAVPDLVAERRFYKDVWGLTEVPSDDGMACGPLARGPKSRGICDLPGTGFTISCLPAKVKGGSAGWNRAVAIFD